MMKHRCVIPDEFTFPSLLKSSAKLTDSRTGGCVHREALRIRYAAFDRVKITIVEMYVGFGTMRDACEVFDEMCERDVVAWNLMIRGFCDSGDVESGLGVFWRMGERRNVVSLNTVILRLAHSGRDDVALEVFKEMREEGVEMDEASLVSVLPACGRIGDLEVGRWVHCYAEEKGILGEVVEKGRDLFASSLDLSTMDAWLMFVLGRRGCLKEAHDLIKSMPMKPNAPLWGALLGACSTHGEVKLAELAAKELIDVEPWNSGNYVLLSNIYAEECRRDEVEKLRELMKKNCIIKDVIKLQHTEENQRRF